MARRNNNGKPKGNSKGTRTQNNQPRIESSPLVQLFNNYATGSNNVATLNFSRSLGSSIPLFPETVYASSDTDLSHRNIVEPGFMVIDVRCNPGPSSTAHSPINIAGLKTYTDVREKANGAKNYDAADLTLHTLTMDTLYLWYAQLIRVHRIIRNGYPYLNDYTPKALVDALGFDFDDIRNHLPEFRAIIDWFVSAVNKMVIPNTSYFKWHRELFELGYSDSADERSQLYLFKPDGLYSYEETTPGEPGYLEFHPWGWDPTTPTILPKYSLSHIQHICDYLFEQVVAVQDLAVMNGDMLRLLGEEGCFKLEYLDPDKEFEIVYDTAMLNAISNMDITELKTDSSANIYQDVNIGAGGIRYVPQLTTGSTNVYTQMGNKIINMHWFQNTPDEVMMATRFMSGIYGTTQLTHGTDIVTSITMYRFVGDTIFGRVTQTVEKLKLVNTYYNVRTASDMLGMMDWLTAFNCAPKIISAYQSANDPQQISLSASVHIFMDTDCYDIFSIEKLDNMHHQAILSLWDVTG